MKDYSKFPKELECVTSDTIAECYEGIVIDGDWSLYQRLWEFSSEAINPTPLGGDGSDGTVETPDGRLDASNDDKAPHWWSKLTPAQQEQIHKAVELTHGE